MAVCQSACSVLQAALLRRAAPSYRSVEKVSSICAASCGQLRVRSLARQAQLRCMPCSAKQPAREQHAGEEPAPRQRAGKQPARPNEKKRVKNVILQIPRAEDGELVTRRFVSLSQAELNDLLRFNDCDAFRDPSLALPASSRSIGDMVDGGTYVFEPVERPTVRTQLGNVQCRSSSAEAACENRLSRFLMHKALEEYPEAAVEELSREPYKDQRGRDLVQVDAGVVVHYSGGGVLLLGEHKMAVDEPAVGNALVKLTKIRLALSDGLSPVLAAALDGVQEIKLYLGGEGLRPGVSEADLLQLLSKQGISLVLPHGGSLGIRGQSQPSIRI